MSSADFWSNQLNKSPTKGAKLTSNRVVTLSIGLAVINVVEVFFRKYFTPNPENKNFKVTDVILYLPGGEIALFEALGANKAGAYALMFE